MLALLHSIATHYSQYGIRPNVLPVGTIETQNRKEETENTEERSEGTSVHDRWLDQHPLGRFGRPDEVADPTLFLASERAGFITGENIVVDGSLTSGLPTPFQNEIYLAESRRPGDEAVSDRPRRRPCSTARRGRRDAVEVRNAERDRRVALGCGRVDVIDDRPVAVRRRAPPPIPRRLRAQLRGDDRTELPGVGRQPRGAVRDERTAAPAPLFQLRGQLRRGVSSRFGPDRHDCELINADLAEAVRVETSIDGLTKVDSRTMRGGGSRLPSRSRHSLRSRASRCRRARGRRGNFHRLGGKTDPQFTAWNR